MSQALPPLNAIRAFEAAARLQSFALAARELHVTPGAVSRQVKLLEAALGTQLFTRANRQVRLTSGGSEYQKAASEALDRLRRATAALRSEGRERPLRVRCAAIVAMRWLFPRLRHIHASHPQMPLDFTTTLTTAHSDFDRADVVIRMGSGRFVADLARHRLFDSQLVAVCSPRLLEGGPPLREVADLRGHTLLTSGLRPHAWQRWLKAAGHGDLVPKRMIEFENSALAYDAAEKGLGVTLAERAFILEDLRRRSLALPLPFVLSDGEAFFLVYPKQSERKPYLAAFRDWVLAEARPVRLALAKPPQVTRVADVARRRAAQSAARHTGTPTRST
ncbi:MAG: LysR family transcriptional regulator [Burkholderiales bacterium]|nr:LysR family transcriptional regulator [Burkholderiales bacterium]